MSRKILLETTYTFTPSTRTVVVPKYIPRERLILITNVTKNQVIYNFSDPALTATTYTPAINATTLAETTTIVLNYNTALMASTDKLQITIDDYAETFTPAETLLDPVNKLRVSQPQSMIDTDFEYGTQVTKWENLGLTNNRPSFYQNATPLQNISAIAMATGSSTVTVTTSSAHNLTVGTPITVIDAFLDVADGNFIIETVPTGTTFTYTALSQNPSTTTALFDQFKTLIVRGAFFTGAGIGGAPTAMTYDGVTGAVTVTTSTPHNLSLGNEICVVGVTATTNAPNGNFSVATVLTPTQFVYYANAIPTGTLAFASATIYARNQAYFVHRPFDGGVFFSTNAGSANQQAIRQTRKYFRYQSGKALQMSSGTTLKPTFQIDSLTSSGTTVTVITKERHNLQPGASVVVSGATETAYNGTFTVTQILSTTSFRYTAASTPSATPASGQYGVAVTGWTGAANRIGMFDDQNGMFWEYDGITLNAVRRSSTYQLAGKVTVTANSSTVTQTNTDIGIATAFSKQLNIGDYVVIRGMSYRVQHIKDDTEMTISPDYRGPSTSFVNITKTTELRVPQSQFNIDKVDGTGPSGFNIDLTKMQMFYIDYTWYGAGFIRFGVRGPMGNVIYVHKIPNNNVNSEAYMRSGNLPARYEANTMARTTRLTATLANTGTTATVLSTAGFPSSGTLCIRNGSNYEYMNYTGITSTTFTGLTRAQAGTAAQTVTVASGANSGTVTANTGIQIGQRVVSTGFPDNTFVSGISGTTITFSQAATVANPSVIFAPMAGTAQTFTYAAADHIAVELAFPSFGPSLNHWGTSVIMDGRFDDDKSLVFTYGQSRFTTIAASGEIALFSLRVAPSVDNGQISAFGGRELINRLQLTMDALGITTNTAGSSLLVRLILNGTPSTTNAWTNAIGNKTGVINSSLGQICDYAAAASSTTTVSGGETLGGFLVSGTDRLDLTNVRALGNSILGGGGANSNSQIYPDGPDTITVVVQNLSTSASASVLGRISWTEAQA